MAARNEGDVAQFLNGFFQDWFSNYDQGVAMQDVDTVNRRKKVLRALLLIFYPIVNS